MKNLKKAVEGVDYTLNKDGTFNVRRRGRYINKDGVLYINKQTKQLESKENEIQK